MKKNKIISNVMAVVMLCPFISISQASAEENADANIVETDRYICEYLGAKDISLDPNNVDVGEGRHIVTDPDSKASQLIDEQGNVLRDVTGYEFETVLKYGREYSDGLLLLKFTTKTPTDRRNYYIIDDVYEYIDIDGNTAFTYTNTYEENISGNGGGFAVSGLWSDTDNEIYYARNLLAFHNGHAAFYNRENKGYGFFDKQGNVITKELYDTVYPFAGNFAIVIKKEESESKSKYGLIDTNGDYVLPCEYDYISVASVSGKNWFSAKKNSDTDAKPTLYYISDDGKIEEIYSTSNGKGLVCDENYIYELVDNPYNPWYYIDAYVYDIETKELIIPEQACDYNTLRFPSLSKEWNQLYTNCMQSVNFYNLKGEKILDTDKSVMQWDKKKDYFAIKDTDENNNSVYTIVDKSMNTIVENGRYIADDRFIAKDENGFYSASFDTPDVKTDLPYDSIYYVFKNNTDVYNDIFSASNTSVDDTGRYVTVSKLIDSKGTVLIDRQCFGVDSETGIVSAYEYIEPSEGESYGKKVYHYYKITPKIAKGDVDNDGAVTAGDASLVLADYARMQSGQSSEFTESQLKAADFNEDGVVNADDASLILAYYAAMSTGKDAE